LQLDVAGVSTHGRKRSRHHLNVDPLSTPPTLVTRSSVDTSHRETP
jgi:hypothetical protein